MAESSSAHETPVRSVLLTIKPNQNLLIELTPFAYDPYMLQVVECLKYSPLVIPLTKVKVVLMSFLIQVYSTAVYDKVNERICFNLLDQKTPISKNCLCSLLGFSYEASMVNPESITTTQLLSMFDNMGYTELLTVVTKVKKSCLPPQWKGLFTLMFKGLSERVVGLDGASKIFMTILYGIYIGIHLD